MERPDSSFITSETLTPQLTRDGQQCLMERKQMWPEPAGHVLSDGRKLFSNWYCLPGAPGASGDVKASLSMLVNTAAPVQGKPWARGAADGVLQVQDRARKKIQISAHLICFPAVDYSPSAFLKVFFLWSFASYCLEDKCSPQAPALEAEPLQQS